MALSRHILKRYSTPLAVACYYKFELSNGVILPSEAAHGQVKPVYGDVEVYTAFDGEGSHYQVLRSGWNQGRRVYGSLIHIDLKGSKIWIQYDGTEVGVANELVELGIPKQDIVLAYHS